MKHYEACGPLSFGAVTAFQEKFDVPSDPEEVIIDLKEPRVVDYAAIEALSKPTERYAKVGKKVSLKHLSHDCLLLLDNASSIIDVNYVEGPPDKLG